MDLRIAIPKAQELLAEWLGVPASAFRAGARVGDEEIDLLVKSDWGRLVVEFKGSAATASVRGAIEQVRRLASAPHHIAVVAVPHMGEVGRRLCEEEGVSWFDLSGNAHLVARGLRILVSGRPNASPTRGRPSTVFAPRSARIARRLLIDPKRVWRQRELAREVGLDEGFVSRIVGRLVEDGELERVDAGLRVVDPRKLLDAWAAEYDFRKHTVLAGQIVGTSGEARVERISEVLGGRVQYAMTGLAGAWLLTKFASFRIATTFLTEPPSKRLLSDLGFREEPRGANTWLVIPNDDGVFDGQEKIDGVACAHPAQVFLDLAGHPERAKEAADEVRKRKLRWTPR